MAKKPSPAELKKQGAELSKTIAEMRKKEHNFAMQIGKEGLVFMADKKKPADALWRMAKKDGGSSKGAKGTAIMKGKVMELTCDDPDNVPSSIVRLAKAFFADRGVPAKVAIMDAPGEEGEDEAAEETATEETSGEAEASSGSEQEEASTSASSDGGGEAEAGGESGTAEETPAAASSGDSETDALREQFEELTPDFELVEASSNQGLGKKIGGLRSMFESQLGGNNKKARAILGLIQTTLQTARDAGDIAEAATEETQPSEGDGATPPEGATQASDGSAQAANPAAAERLSRLADLERGVDELLAEFA